MFMFHSRILTPKEYERLIKISRETIARDYFKQIQKQNNYLFFRNKFFT